MKSVRMFFSLAVLLILSSYSFAQKMPEVGTKAPNFTLQDASGKSYTLSDYIGKSPVVIYFYCIELVRLADSLVKLGFYNT